MTTRRFNIRKSPPTKFWFERFVRDDRAEFLEKIERKNEKSSSL